MSLNGLVTARLECDCLIDEPGDNTPVITPSVKAAPSPWWSFLVVPRTMAALSYAGPIVE